ncbi:MAG: hypothetical protein ACFCUL_01620 [Flavobacteriaceae bacterium]
MSQRKIETHGSMQNLVKPMDIKDFRNYGNVDDARVYPKEIKLTDIALFLIFVI